MLSRNFYRVQMPRHRSAKQAFASADGDHGTLLQIYRSYMQEMWLFCAYLCVCVRLCVRECVEVCVCETESVWKCVCERECVSA
jgi:hypothetical protein